MKSYINTQLSLYGTAITLALGICKLVTLICLQVRKRVKLEGAELDAYYLKLREEREATKKAEMLVCQIITHNPTALSCRLE